MRTGSNLLETYLNDFPNIECHGEAFNPSFVGYPKKTNLFGVSLEMREADPFALIDLIKDQDGLNGFRYFHDHDPRVFEHCLSDTACAKIVLTRNPLDSYVSHQIAKQTGQWKLTNPKFLKSVKIMFDIDSFQLHLQTVRSFHDQIKRNLQRTGQTAFYIDYDDLKDLDTINGIASFLGQADEQTTLSQKLKKQNPGGLYDKVENYDEMVTAVSTLDFFDLSRFPNYEPDRGPNVPSYIAAASAPLLYLPLPGGPGEYIRKWLADIEGANPSDLIISFNQKTLRQWKRTHLTNKSFTILRHPIERAHAVFCKHIVSVNEDSFPIVREYLRNAYKLHLPKAISSKTYSLQNHHDAFLGFLRFAKASLNGQTAIRIDPTWASQSSLLSGISKFIIPDMVLREDALQDGLTYLTSQIKTKCPQILADHTAEPYDLAQIYDAEIEAAARAAYKKDYIAFGFMDWRDSSSGL